MPALHSDAFDVIPYEVREAPRQTIRIMDLNSYAMSRTSKETGRSWDQALSEMSTRVRASYLPIAPSSPAWYGTRHRLYDDFLCVGNYLGIDVAIKEVLPSNDYDVAKYFEREWRLMKCVLLFGFSADSRTGAH